MSDKVFDAICSAPGPAGKRSKRKFTRQEIAAAKRLGFVEGSEKQDTLGGPLFWATGNYYVDLVEQQLKDAQIASQAMKREWDKY